MELVETKLKGVYIIKNKISKDVRGEFAKIYNKEIFEQLNLCIDFREQYYSISNKNVIRGMHFQTPPYEHEKLVHVPKGAVQDVIVDLRKTSTTYGEYVCIELSDKNRESVYIPKGCAHGFKAIVDGTITLYNVASIYNNSCDSGIKWDSFGFNWNIDQPIISERDKTFSMLKDFNSPF